MTDDLWWRSPFSAESAAGFFARSGVQRPARLLTKITHEGLQFQEVVLHVEGGRGGGFVTAAPIHPGTSRNRLPQLHGPPATG